MAMGPGNCQRLATPLFSPLRCTRHSHGTHRGALVPCGVAWRRCNAIFGNQAPCSELASWCYGSLLLGLPRCLAWGIPSASERGAESEVAHKWARWLHNPCHLGDPLRFRAGGRIKSGPRWLHNLFCAFQPFLNSPQNSEYFEYRHIGSNKKNSPAVCLKQNLRRLWRRQSTLFCATNLGSVEGGVHPPPFGVGSRPGAPPVIASRFICPRGLR